MKHPVTGDFDTAVFEAFKKVEIEVRRKGGYPDTAIGVSLMWMEHCQHSGSCAC